MNEDLNQVLSGANGHEMTTYRDHLKQEIREKVHNQRRMDGKHWETL